MNFKPLSDHVLVEQVEAKTQTASGLILPSSDVEKPQQATVLEKRSRLMERSL